MSALPPLRSERPDDAPAVAALIAAAFGPGRFAKAAERLREGRGPELALSFVAWDGGRLAGSVRLWPVSVGGAACIFLGPIAVDMAWRGRGLGEALVETACAAAAQAGWRAVLLVGDAPYFGRMGFEIAPGVEMPGPVDRRRVLARALVEGGTEALVGAVLA
ncbi:putative N-acetyltransferase YhbS [Caulobacter ginsengisoli]|uniref:N-acetyltransferase YhbS n=1 Tax=Caulobacter ginsengisoli TaxID=400775 RepID=A0ABU0IVJ2_9CAUL|nr:N-acetyltransferase [Caulobacter ginsengisoli]MDQ0466024.1 putative N-acetyltransferase YhbS [Caulobacter ginsengisoli]